jgi:hypothetical protein
MKLADHNFFTWVPDRTYLKLVWWLSMDYPLNLENPRTYNEKLQWLKLNDRDPLHTALADKYEVRKYIGGKIGEQYLVPLLGVYNSVDEINWDALPNQFVLKCNHDSGSVVICKDKSALDINAVKKKISKRLRDNSTYNKFREWPYKNIRRRIICEKYMSDETGELTDYKFLCFDGEPKVMFIATERNSGVVKFDYYDIHFNHLNITQVHLKSGITQNKPKGFVEMIRLSKIISQNIPHIRVDLYEKNGKVYFGELTLFHHAGLVGFNPNIIDELWGSWINLTHAQKSGCKNNVLTQIWNEHEAG